MTNAETTLRDALTRSARAAIRLHEDLNNHCCGGRATIAPPNLEAAWVALVAAEAQQRRALRAALRS